MSHAYIPMKSVTISGVVDSIDLLKDHLENQGVFTRLLKTNDKAYHSPEMSAIGQEIRRPYELSRMAS